MAAAVMIYYGFMTREEAMFNLKVDPSFNTFLWNVEGLRGGGQGRLA